MSCWQKQHSKVADWRRFLALYSALVTVLVGGAPQLAYSQSASQSGGSSKSATGTKLQGGVSKTDLGVDLEGHFGVAVRKADKPFKAIVDNIRPGSMAFYSGLRIGDRILAADGNGDKVSLTFDRDGKIYGVKLAPLSPQVLNRPAGVPLDPATLPLEQKRKMIADHDVVLIIDRTKSMDTPDCPGGLSRWNWCRDQALHFMKDMDGYINDVTIVTFNETHETYRHQSAKNIGELLSTIKPDGATNTVGPLRAVLDDYFQRRAAGKARPLLIAVITDGLPNLPDDPKIAKMEVQEEIVNTVGHMNNAGEITLTFLQVGRDFGGGQFLTDLAEHLGVPYDIVDTRTFADLQRIGLRDALVDALCSQKIYSVEGKVGVPKDKK